MFGFLLHDTETHRSRLHQIKTSQAYSGQSCSIVRRVAFMKGWRLIFKLQREPSALPNTENSTVHLQSRFIVHALQSTHDPRFSGAQSRQVKSLPVARNFAHHPYVKRHLPNCIRKNKAHPVVSRSVCQLSISRRPWDHIILTECLET